MQYYYQDPILNLGSHPELSIKLSLIDHHLSEGAEWFWSGKYDPGFSHFSFNWFLNPADSNLVLRSGYDQTRTSIFCYCGSSVIISGCRFIASIHHFPE